MFVVCGTREHVEQLHFSLRALRHFSKNEILVLTDAARNEITVEWSNVIDISTSPEFNHHQSSIFLKTAIHRFLPQGNRYCYLDTDVIAIDQTVDDIFNHKTGAVTFAKDHCTMPKFSPYAVNCDCLERNKQEIAELEYLMEKYNPLPHRFDPEMMRKRKELLMKFHQMKKDKLGYFLISLRFNAAFRKFRLDENYHYDKRKKAWCDKEGRVLFPKIQPRSMERDIEKNSHWRWNDATSRWVGPDGRDVFDLQCPHLAQYISEKFGIAVSDKNFQHWNGGVFLFDDASHQFLESWHRKTMAIFKDPRWKTRDQGTLIATAWEFGMQHNPLLPVEFNFIADYNHPTMVYKNNLTFDVDENHQNVRPHFIHIYHHWGDAGWKVWNDVEAHVNKVYA